MPVFVGAASRSGTSAALASPGKRPRGRPRKSDSSAKAAAAPATDSGKRRRGYSYVHGKTGKLVHVPGSDEKAAAPLPRARTAAAKSDEGSRSSDDVSARRRGERSAEYQSRRASEQLERSESADAECAARGTHVPSEEECEAQGRVRRSGSARGRGRSPSRVTCATCVEPSAGRRRRGGSPSPVRVFLEKGTLAPYRLSDANEQRRREDLRAAVERLAKKYAAEHRSESPQKALRAATNKARGKLQALSLMRKYQPAGTPLGKQCTTALEDEAWFRREYGFKPLDWSGRTCHGKRGASRGRARKA